MKIKVRPEVNKLNEILIQNRRLLHSQPELGFQENKTSDYIEKFLRNLKLKPKRIAKTGIMVDFEPQENKSTYKTIAFRADIDALPIFEENTFSFASKNKGVMHACGHDAHTSILLGFAKFLKNNPNLYTNQKIRLLFQPAEEGLAGAKVMIEDGCLKNVDSIFGLHVWSTLPVGQASMSFGPMMAGTNSFQLNIFGKGGHAAAPHETIDSSFIASQICVNIQSIVSRTINPKDPAVITIGSIQAGSAHNIIADKAKMLGTLRAMEPKVMKIVKSKFEAYVREICKIHGAKYELNYLSSYPPLVNNSKLSHFANSKLTSIFGKKNVHEGITLGGEDFAFYLEKIPGCFYFIGAQNPKKGCIYPHHHPKFNIDEDSMIYGLESFVQIADSSNLDTNI